MKISIHKAKPPKHSADRPYMMVSVDPEEAAAIIASLARQLQKHSPNAERLETLVYSGDFIGHVSICVSLPQICLECGKDIGFMGKRESEGLLCLEHMTHRERGEKDKDARLENAWAEQSKKIDKAAAKKKKNG